MMTEIIVWKPAQLRWLWFSILFFLPLPSFAVSCYVNCGAGANGSP